MLIPNNGNKIRNAFGVPKRRNFDLISKNANKPPPVTWRLKPSEAGGHGENHHLGCTHEKHHGPVGSRASINEAGTWLAGNAFSQRARNFLFNNFAGRELTSPFARPLGRRNSRQSLRAWKPFAGPAHRQWIPSDSLRGIFATARSRVIAAFAYRQHPRAKPLVDCACAR